MLGLMRWCTTCDVGWALDLDEACELCGEPGTKRSPVADCVSSTGFAAEGAKYARAHPGWRLDSLDPR